MLLPKKGPFGVTAPMPTPLCEQGELRPRAIHTPVDFLVRDWTDSLPIGGSTGAGQTLSADALRACVSVVREAIPGQSTFRGAGRPRSAGGLPTAFLQSGPRRAFLGKKRCRP